MKASLHITGVVQGVGYRPFVHRLAVELGISGSVRNDGTGVVVEAAATEGTLREFAQRLSTDAPPLARVRAVELTLHPDDAGVAAERVGQRRSTFAIVESTVTAGATTALPPDVAVCDACLMEMRDHGDRRYRYPFVTCTDCGPRFTITRHMPYDRPNTTMAAFELCADCRREYDDPADRRHHAQPLACPACGPHMMLTDTTGAILADRDHAIRQAQQMLRDGDVVAVKGVGGFHLMCDAANAEAVAQLRARKQRGDKPFAVLVADTSAVARAGLVLSEHEQAVLGSSARPIVLLRRSHEHHIAAWAEHCAPGAADVGVMLPSTPLQHLLLDGLDGLDALVCTSGNVADEPIAIDDDEARRRLAQMADAFLGHDRPIHNACDDSVVRVHGAEVALVRRARGHVPLPVALADVGPTVLAMGGDLKGALCLAVGDLAFMSQHLGDHGQLATLAAARRAAEQLCDLVSTTPHAVAVDAHPAYLSARLGRELAATWGVPVVEVQHHHAHAMALAAEHGVDELVALTFDGTGYGPDGSIWGGEVLRARADGFKRLAFLRPVPLPGGDAAIEHPSRTALAHLWAAGVEWLPQLAPVAAIDATERAALRAMLEAGAHTVPTSSAGRLFDAVAALCGVRQRVQYEAQAAIELEAIADLSAPGAYSFPPPDAAGAINCSPVIQAVVADLLAGTPPSTVSIRFHRAFVSLLDVHSWRSGRDTNEFHGADGVPVGLTGGVFQNLLLVDLFTEALTREGVRVLHHRQVPTNDGGLALGQALIARAGMEGLG